jgi:hypothetical protein
LTRRAAKRKRQTMVLTVGGLAGRPPIDKRCRSQRSGRVALCDCILAKVLLLCLTTVPCSSDETRMVVSEDTSEIKSSPSQVRSAPRSNFPWRGGNLFDGFLAFNCQSCAVKISAIFKYKCNQVYTRMSSSVSLKGSNEYAS